MVCHSVRAVPHHLTAGLPTRLIRIYGPFSLTKTPKQKDFYELYAIRKFGAEKYCTSEDRSVFFSVLGGREKNKKNKES